MAAETSSITRVALFADLKCTDEKSREAAFRVLSADPAIKVDKVTSSSIMLPSFSNDYDVLILPGGSGGGEAAAMGEEGGKRIAAFTRAGKGVVAICAGGYYVAEGWNPVTKALELINGKNWDGKHWARGEGFIVVKTAEANDEESSKTMWFENGPIFVPADIDGVPAYTPLVKYVTDLAAKGAPTGMMQGRDAVVAAPFGKGRVVVFGPHPELSPGLGHWLTNAVKWSAAIDDGSAPTVASVLEGRTRH